ncbi:MAG: acyl-CoA thioesterase [Coxiellaceae bacterium]|nr:acyl-CoA thioesterase [Coxiellaceae bacterium]
MMKHEFNLTVYNEDIDYSGVVYHPNYLKYFERARLSWFEELGFGLEQQKNDGFLYTIKNIELDFLRPARMDDRLVVKTSVEIHGRAKAQLRFYQEIDNLTQKISPMTKASIHVVCVNENMRPIPMPKNLVEKLND